MACSDAMIERLIVVKLCQFWIFVKCEWHILHLTHISRLQKTSIILTDSILGIPLHNIHGFYKQTWLQVIPTTERDWRTGWNGRKLVKACFSFWLWSTSRNVQCLLKMYYIYQQGTMCLNKQLQKPLIFKEFGSNMQSTLSEIQAENFSVILGVKGLSI